jgi:spore coat polysaccharide biosynthesis protein SpsF
MKTIAVVEARMTSSRLPGKPLLHILGKPALSHLVQRLHAAESLDEIVLATTTNPADEPLVQFAAEQEITCYRGSEDDVMGRVLEAARSASGEIIVEVTGDCVVNDPGVIERVIRLYREANVDYVSNCHEPGFPIGIDAQVFPTETLARSEQMTSDPLDREHVTRHIIRHEDDFTKALLRPRDDEYWPELGLALDEPADLGFLSAVLAYFEDQETIPTCSEIIHVLRNVHPEWLQIIKLVQRKGLDE